MADRPKDTIRIKTMCIFVHDGKTLGGRGYDDLKKEEFWRVIGGSLDFNESAEEGIRREVREELGCDIENLTLVDVVENRYVYKGEKGHDIVFLFKGDLSDKSLCEQSMIHIEDFGYEFDADWISIDDVLSGKKILYPAFDWQKFFK